MDCENCGTKLYYDDEVDKSVCRDCAEKYGVGE